MKWGILGTGVIARKFAQTVQQMQAEGEALVAVASRSEETANSFAAEIGVPRAYGTYAAMMADPNVDAVYIATPNSFHAEHSRLSLENGKHVLCEKPFALNPGQAKPLYELARQRGLFIMEAFWIRFLPALRKMQELIAAGEIGDVRHIRSDYGFIPSSEDRGKLKLSADLGAGALMDIGIYNLGFVHMGYDAAPQHFSSSVHVNGQGTDDFSAVLLEYPGERSAAIVTSIGMEIPREAAVLGTLGQIALHDFQMAQSFTVRKNDGSTRDYTFPFDVNGFEYEIREVNRCVRAGLHTSDILRESDTLTVLEAMTALRKSWGVQFPGEA